MDIPYSNREIDNHFKDVKETLERIENQTTATNGKVASIQTWRERTNGAMMVVTTILVPILGWALWQVSTIDDTVKEVLSTYDITIKR